jgi:hypothetical protein
MAIAICKVYLSSYPIQNFFKSNIVKRRKTEALRISSIMKCNQKKRTNRRNIAKTDCNKENSRTWQRLYVKLS